MLFWFADMPLYAQWLIIVGVALAIGGGGIIAANAKR